MTVIFGVFCRRWGVPLVDGGTVRLPRLIGASRAMDMILTGREVDAQEALSIGLANRVVPKGKSLEAATEIAEMLCNFPNATMLADRQSAIEQWSLSETDALNNEYEPGCTCNLPSSSTQDKISSFDRAKEPKSVRVREGSSLEWGTEKAITNYGSVPDIIYDLGGIRKEEMIRVIAKDMGSLIDKILSIHNLHKKER